MVRVAVIGTGVMGTGIAAHIVFHGHDVVLYDIDPEKASRAQEYIHKLASALGQECKGSLRIGGSLEESVDNVEIVFEAIIEEYEVKRSLYKSLAPHLDKDTPLATNTSTFTVRELGRGLEIADRLIAVHWMNPPYVIPIVEVAISEHTRPNIYEKTIGFLESIDKHVIEVPDIPGFIVNRFNRAVYREALDLIANYGVSPDTIDKIWKLHLAPVYGSTGVLGTMDYVGLDTIARSAGSLQSPPSEKEQKIIQLILNKLEDNELGVKTGKGFYTYMKNPFFHYVERAKHLRGVLKCLEDMSL